MKEKFIHDENGFKTFLHEYHDLIVTSHNKLIMANLPLTDAHQNMRNREIIELQSSDNILSKNYKIDLNQAIIQVLLCDYI